MWKQNKNHIIPNFVNFGPFGCFVITFLCYRKDRISLLLCVFREPHRWIPLRSWRLHRYRLQLISEKVLKKYHLYLYNYVCLHVICHLCVPTTFIRLRWRLLKCCADGRKGLWRVCGGLGLWLELRLYVSFRSCVPTLFIRLRWNFGILLQRQPGR